MIRQIIAVLKKHLDEAYDDYDEMNEALQITPFDILAAHPDQHQLGRLAYELIGVVKGTDVAKLVTVPKHVELFNFLKRISYDGTDEDLMQHQTRELRIFIAGLRTYAGHGLITRF